MHYVYHRDKFCRFFISKIYASIIFHKKPSGLTTDLNIRNNPFVKTVCSKFKRIIWVAPRRDLLHVAVRNTREILSRRRSQ